MGTAASVQNHLRRCTAGPHSRSVRVPVQQFEAETAANIARTTVLDEPQKRVSLTRLANMPEGDRLCHGDFHPINVLGEISRPVVIDWPDACSGDPAADVCRSYLLLRLHAADIAEPPHRQLRGTTSPTAGNT